MARRRLKFDIHGDHYLYFADGTTSQIADKRKFKDSDGTTKWQFLLWPTRRQILLYNLAEDDYYDGNENIIRRSYKAYNVEIIENNPSRTRIWVYTDFNGNDTATTNREAYLTEQIDVLEKEVKSLRTTLATLHQELHIERTNQLLAMEDKVAIVKSARKASAQTGEGGFGMEPEDSMGAGGG